MHALLEAEEYRYAFYFLWSSLSLVMIPFIPNS
jgi:hypothetical protein